MTTALALDLATIAAEEFNRRREKANQAIARGEMTPGRAEAHLRPWLAVAAAAGADLPEMREGDTRLCAEQIAPGANWRPILAAARDRAIQVHHAEPTPRREATARRLMQLANTLTTIPFHPEPPSAARSVEPPAEPKPDAAPATPQAKPDPAEPAAAAAPTQGALFA